MDKESIIKTLQSIVDQIPRDLISADMDKEEALSDTLRQRNGETETLEKIINDIDYEDTDEIKALATEFDDELEALQVAKDAHAKLASQIERVDQDLLKYQNAIEINKNAILNSVSSETKEMCEAAETKFENKISEFEEKLDALRKQEGVSLEDIKAREAKIADMKLKLTTLRAERMSAAIAKKTEEIAKHERNIGFLDSKAGFISLGVVDKLNEYMEKYRSGEMNDAQLNRCMWRIRDAIGSDEIIEKYAALAGEKFEEERRVRQARILELTEKLGNNAGYELTPEEEQEEAGKLELLRRDRDNIRAKVRRRERNLEENEALLVSATSEEERIRLEQENAVINAEKDKFQTEWQTKVDEINALNSKKTVSALKSADEEELNKLQAEEAAASYFERVHSMKLMDKINVVLLATGSTTEELVEANKLAADKRKVIVTTPKATGKVEDLPEPKFKTEEKDDDLITGAIPVGELGNIDDKEKDEKKEGNDSIVGVPVDLSEEAIAEEPEDLSGEKVDEEEDKENGIYAPIEEEPIDPNKFIGSHKAKESLLDKLKKKKVILVMAAVIAAILAVAGLKQCSGPQEIVATPTPTPTAVAVVEEEEDKGLKPNKPNLDKEDDEEKDEDLNPTPGCPSPGCPTPTDPPAPTNPPTPTDPPAPIDPPTPAPAEDGHVLLGEHEVDGEMRPDEVINTENDDDFGFHDGTPREDGRVDVDLDEDLTPDHGENTGVSDPTDQPGGEPTTEVVYDGSEQSLVDQGASEEVVEQFEQEIKEDLSSDEEVSQNMDSSQLLSSIEKDSVAGLEDLKGLADAAAPLVLGRS